MVSIQDTERIGIQRFGLMVRGSAILVYILTKNITAGPRIKIVDRYRDDASGPKINLPPHRNFCKENEKIKVGYKSKKNMNIDHSDHSQKAPYMKQSENEEEKPENDLNIKDKLSPRKVNMVLSRF